MSSRKRAIGLLFLVMSLFLGCAVGPDYHRPPASVPATYKELKGGSRQSLKR